MWHLVCIHLAGQGLTHKGIISVCDPSFCLTWELQLNRKTINNIWRWFRWICFCLQTSAESWFLFAKATSLHIIMDCAHVSIPGFAVNHRTISANSWAISPVCHFWGQKGETEQTSQGLCTELCKYLSGGYLKCSGALLQASFEGLNQGLEG